MEKKDIFTKGLAITGTALVWFPLLAPMIASVILFIAERDLRFDYLMPAEFFPVAAIGGGLLLWAAVGAHTRRGIIGGSLVIAASALAGGQALAVATGLASGACAPTGWPWALVIASLVIYTLALAIMGVSGALLAHDLRTHAPAPTARA
jgi:hypothetical protein